MATPQKKSTDGSNDGLSWRELERVLDMAELEEFTTLSRDTIVRRHADKVVRLSPRRLGMKLRNALLIVNGK